MADDQDRDPVGYDADFPTPQQERDQDRLDTWDGVLLLAFVFGIIVLVICGILGCLYVVSKGLRAWLGYP